MLAVTDIDDTDLLAKARGGDRAAFGVLLDRHYDFIHRVAWRFCGNRDDAEDVAQEVCLRFARSVSGFRGEGQLTTWLYRLVLNAVRDRGRRVARERAGAVAYAVHALTADVIPTDPADEADALWEAVRELPAKQMQAVVLVYGEGLGHEAAGEVMGCAAATVSWHVHEAKKRLKALLRPGRRD